MLVATVLALIVGLRRQSDFPRVTAFSSAQFIWLIVFLLAQCFSVYYGGPGSIMDEFAYWNVYAVFVIISVLLISNPEMLRRYVWGMMVGSMVVVIYGIYSVPAWGGYIGSGRAGAYGMYENHNDYTFIIIQVFPFLFMYMRQETSVLRRFLLGLSLLACILGTFMSLSRGGMIALMLEIVLAVIIGMQGKRRWLIVPVVVILAIGAISYQYAKRAENQGEGYTAEDAEAGRMELWIAGFNMFLHNPILGVGSRRFPEYSWQYADLSHDMRGKVSHNTYIEVLSSTGIIGIGSFLLMLRSLVKRLRISSLHRSPWLEATRKATLIALLTLLFRAFLDAKPHDWSFYVLCSIAISLYAIDKGIVRKSGLSGQVQVLIKSP